MVLICLFSSRFSNLQMVLEHQLLLGGQWDHLVHHHPAHRHHLAVQHLLYHQDSHQHLKHPGVQDCRLLQGYRHDQLVQHLRLDRFHLLVLLHRVGLGLQCSLVHPNNYKYSHLVRGNFSFIRKTYWWSSVSSISLITSASWWSRSSTRTFISFLTITTTRSL